MQTTKKMQPLMMGDGGCSTERRGVGSKNGNHKLHRERRNSALVSTCSEQVALAPTPNTSAAQDTMMTPPTPDFERAKEEKKLFYHFCFWC